MSRREIGRRESFRLVSGGIVMFGAGTVAMLETSTAAAGDRQMQLRFLKVNGKATEALDTIVLPAAVAAEIEAGNAASLEFVWHEKQEKRTRKLAEHPAPGRARLADRKKKPAAK